MKKIILLLLFVTLRNVSFSQNLVPNPSFESYSSCPNVGQIFQANGWINCGATPELFAPCGSLNGVGSPANQFGYQNAASGVSYAGLFTYWKDSPNLREYIATQLSSNLIIGTKYFVSMKACAAFAPISQVGVTLDFSNNLGFLFTTYIIDSSIAQATNKYQVKYNSIISDTINWTVISGSFIADSSYSYLTLGNFLDDSSISVDSSYNPSNSAFHTSYYYIDNVCVTNDSLYNENYITGIRNTSPSDFEVIFSPNPTKNNFIIKSSNLTEILEVDFYNIYGQAMKTIPMPFNFIDISEFSPGTYYVKINRKNKPSITKKIIKIN